AANVKKDRALYRDVQTVLDYYEKKDTLDIPINIKTKFDCLKTLCKLKIDGRTTDNAINSIEASKKYDSLESFLTLKLNEDVKAETIIDNVRQIRLRKKLSTLYENYGSLTTFLDSLKDGSFDCIDDVVNDYETIIRSMYTEMMTANRGVAIEASSSLDLVQDDFDHVLALIKKKYERKNAIATGFPIFDNDILNGGFEPSRVYVIAGASGSGKSTLTNNFIVNSATKDMTIIDGEQVTEAKKDGINRVFVYITLENTIEESLLRTYQPLFRKRIDEVLREITNGVDIKKKLMDELKRTGSTIVMKYFPAMSISILDIMSVLDEVIDEYGKDAIKGLYIDYLDLLKTDTKYDLYRIELGQITLSLKSLAVDYNIPVIVPTQLGRSAYRIEEARNLSVDLISESIKKVEHADCVILLSKDPVKEDVVHCQVGKNRSGKSNVSLDFKVDFSIFKFVSGSKITNEQKKDDITDDQLLDFQGLSHSF
ncbi:MAG: DnaB-like helicase C-terminal domain-containing protein, partial [Candidatus Heimdallarchaeota archaeon]